MPLRRFLFEWEDLPWFPARIRAYMLDFLTFFLKVGKLYDPIAALLVRKVETSDSKVVFDLASGGAGPLESLLPQLKKAIPHVQGLLSDLYPNPMAWRRLEGRFPQTVKGIDEPVNALALPSEQEALFTMFSALHHFDPETLKSLLSHLPERRQAALFCDGGGNRLMLLGGVLLMPFFFLLATPFLKPFRWRRLLFTYVIPVVPFCTLWDGTVSILRLYSFRELKRLAAQCSTPEYRWKAGKFRKFRGVYVYVLEGTPQ